MNKQSKNLVVTERINEYTDQRKNGLTGKNELTNFNMKKPRDEQMNEQTNIFCGNRV